MSAEPRLRGNVALVTGASRGVGAAVALALAKRGVGVIVNYREKARRAEEVAAAARAIGVAASAVQANLTVRGEVEVMIGRIREEFGRLDLVVLNASGGLERDQPASYAMALNRDAQIQLVEAALPLLAPGGRIVFVTSHLAHFHGSRPGFPDYDVVAESKKAGEDALRAMTDRLTAQGVSLIVVSGDLIEGTITPKLLSRRSPGLIEARRATAGGLPTTEEFAEEIARASADVSLVSGATVYVGSIA